MGSVAGGDSERDCTGPERRIGEEGDRGQTVSRGGGAEHHPPFVSTHVLTAQTVQQISTSLTIRISRPFSLSLSLNCCYWSLLQTKRKLLIRPITVGDDDEPSLEGDIGRSRTRNFMNGMRRGGAKLHRVDAKGAGR